MNAQRLLLALAAATVAGLALAVPAATNPPATKLKIGDAVDVLHTRIACFAITSNGKDGIGCVLWSKGKPVVRSYGVGLAVDGTAVVTRIAADGSATNVLKKRALASARTVMKAEVGDMFGLPAPHGHALGCRVLNITSHTVAPVYRGIKVSCWLATETKPLPSTYGVSISDKFAGMFRFTAASATSRWGVMRRQP